MVYNFERMEAARKKQRKEYVELAYRCGLTEQHIRQIFNGAKGCSEKTMWKIADVLELDPEKLELENSKHKR